MQRRPEHTEKAPTSSSCHMSRLFGGRVGSLYVISKSHCSASPLAQGSEHCAVHCRSLDNKAFLL